MLFFLAPKQEPFSGPLPSNYIEYEPMLGEQREKGGLHNRTFPPAGLYLVNNSLSVVLLDRLSLSPFLSLTPFPLFFSITCVPSNQEPGWIFQRSLAAVVAISDRLVHICVCVCVCSVQCVQCAVCVLCVKCMCV